MSRLFVAVDPPDQVRHALTEVVPRPEGPGVRWVPPDQWHVTLRFLGEADERAAVAALARLRAPRATATIGPRVSRLGRTVVCLPVSGLDDLAGAVEEATIHVGVPPDHRFRGHLTLARLKARAACGVTGTAVSAAFEVGAVRLYRSTLHPDGARHELVAEVALGG
ncbi:RNA 2',3'-cyclic phosphodiesterase [Rhabdothermincola salaria]|uniref:RNA 2',3'-cyclic phosphodiesterase n=1 Tax=Rhabdothermincola salaria TaxID=2903142 RepID=UPI001E52BC52|nr:RNA 2',3'-cyclic phosphodiesterase [Rhabdothermincola salaria]